MNEAQRENARENFFTFFLGFLVFVDNTEEISKAEGSGRCVGWSSGLGER